MSKALGEEWHGLELDPIGLWLHLCRWDYRHAALGLLLDFFVELRSREAHPEDFDAEMPEGGTLNDAVTAMYRERLMEILGDDDGRLLKAWRLRWDESMFGTKQDCQFMSDALNLVMHTHERLRKEAEEEGATP